MGGSSCLPKQSRIYCEIISIGVGGGGQAKKQNNKNKPEGAKTDAL